jgi:hypothetical protein
VLAIEWKASADADLCEILDFISERSEQGAENLLQRIIMTWNMRQNILTFSKPVNVSQACVKSVSIPIMLFYTGSHQTILKSSMSFMFAWNFPVLTEKFDNPKQPI